VAALLFFQTLQKTRDKGFLKTISSQSSPAHITIGTSLLLSICNYPWSTRHAG